MAELMKTVIQAIMNGNFVIVIDNGPKVQVHKGSKISNKKLLAISNKLSQLSS